MSGLEKERARRNTLSINRKIMRAREKEQGMAGRNDLLTARILLSALGVLATFLFASSGTAVAEMSAENATDALPGGLYVADFISTAAFGSAMNDAGDVTGTSYLDPGCGPWCLPPLETVVWRGTERIVLPSIPGLTGIYVSSINNQGWVAGFAGFPGTTTHAVVWKPNGNTYQAIDLGTLPGTTISYAVGIDNTGRVVGWSTTSNFPPSGSPFMWTESAGMIDLSAQGFPDEFPLDISPGGAVATPGYWYRLEDPASVVAMPPPPRGFVVGTESTKINDAGDQARFLISTSTENLRYLFRFYHEGTWQQISSTGNGHLAPYGVGSINSAGDVTATTLGTAVIAYGPDGQAQYLAPLLSSAYQGSTIVSGGPMNNMGQILVQVMIGQSQRLMRLTPAKVCKIGCIQVSSLLMRAKFVQDPKDPGHCYPQNGNAYNLARVNLTVTSKTGVRLKGVLVNGRFLDDYWTNAPVSGTTNSKGIVSFDYRGQCGVGAIAFLVDSAVKSPGVFDRTTGIVTNWTVPK